MIELTSAIRDLCDELEQAVAAGSDRALRFEPGPIELEASVTVERSGGAGAKVRFLIAEFGDAAVGRISTRHIRLVLHPRTPLGDAPFVAGASERGER